MNAPITRPKHFPWVRALEAGKRRLAGDIARAATSGEVEDLRREPRALKEANSNHFRYGTFRYGTFGNVSTFWRAPVS